MEYDEGVLEASGSPLGDFAYRFSSRASLCARGRGNKVILQLDPAVVVTQIRRHLLIPHTRQAHIDIPGEPGRHFVLRSAGMNDAKTLSMYVLALVVDYAWPVDRLGIVG